jgi:hypothetical protein
MMKSFRLLRIALPLLVVSLIWLRQNSIGPELGRLENPKRIEQVRKSGPDASAVILSEVLGEFGAWLENYRIVGNSVDLEKGVSLARKRRALLKRMIGVDPERALTLAISTKGRDGLPEEIVELLETPVSTAGEFERVVSCYLGGIERPADAPTEERFVSFDKKRYRALLMAVGPSCRRRIEFRFMEFRLMMWSPFRRIR